MSIKTFHLRGILLPVTTFIFLSSCGKKSSSHFISENPPTARSQQGVFLCKIDDEPWIAGVGNSTVTASLSGDSISIIATSNQQDGHREQIALFIKNNYNANVKEYLFNDSVNQFVRYQTSSAGHCFIPNIAGSATGAYRKIENGKLQITMANDTAIAGTFYFDIPTDHCDTLHVREGSFTIHLK